MRHGTWTRRIAVLVGLATAMAALPTWAQEEDDEDEETESWYDDSGLYLIGAATYGFPTDENDLERRIEDAFGGPLVTEASDIQGSWGVDARLGYRIDPRAAIEGQFTWLRSFDARVSPVGGGMEEGVEGRFLTTTANAKIFLLTHRWQPYVVAGAGYGWSQLHVSGLSDERDNGFVARAGAGIDLYGTRMVALNVEASYLLATGDVDPFDHVSITTGLTLRFYAED